MDEKGGLLKRWYESLTDEERALIDVWHKRIGSSLPDIVRADTLITWDTSPITFKIEASNAEGAFRVYSDDIRARVEDDFVVLARDLGDQLKRLTEKYLKWEIKVIYEMA